MLNRPSSSRQRKHQLVLSLTPRRLHVLHMHRGLTGWRRRGEHSAPLPDGESFLSEVQAQLQQCVAQWRVPTGARIHWVLASDILGVMAPPLAGNPQVAVVLPFAPSDVRTETDRFGSQEPPSMLWIHNDWVAEIERVSTACRLECVELYARAQMFQKAVAGLPGSLKAVLEGQTDAPCLHLYGPAGGLLRSRTVDTASQTPALADLLAVEIAAQQALAGLDSAAPPAAGGVRLLAPASVLSSLSDSTLPTGLTSDRLVPLTEADLLEALWRSSLEGIVIQPTHDDLVQYLRLVGLGAGAAGVAALALMYWHDGELQRRIEQDRQQVRKNLPAVEAAKALKARTLQMADVVQAAAAIRDNTQPMSALEQVLASFPPPPATLLYVQADAGSVALSASGNAAGFKRLRETRWAGYGAPAEAPAPDFLQGHTGVLHLQARKTDAHAVPGASTPTHPAGGGTP